MRDVLWPPADDVTALVALALAEDLAPDGDITSSVMDPKQVTQASFVARSVGVLAGTYCVAEIISQLDFDLEIKWQLADGDSLVAGEAFGILSGPINQILSVERICLNFISHLSGIATNASVWVAEASGHCRVADTRKTLPGYRQLQKAAVRSGGGMNHRMSLSAAAMFKDNHLTGIDIATAVSEFKQKWPNKPVEVEADTVAQAQAAATAGADIIMFDNFAPAEIAGAVADLKAFVANQDLTLPTLEASGGITLETLSSYATSGVDFVSVGALTNAAEPIDIGLDIVA